MSSVIKYIIIVLGRIRFFSPPHPPLNTTLLKKFYILHRKNKIKVHNPYTVLALSMTLVRASPGAGWTFSGRIPSAGASSRVGVAAAAAAIGRKDANVTTHTYTRACAAQRWVWR